MRKGQEEMTGFALIVIIVAIVGVFFLAFALKRDSGSSYESLEVQQFLDSAMLVQSQCKIAGSIYFARVDDLMQRCYENKADSCDNGNGVCNYLEDFLKEVTLKGWNIGPEAFYTGYKLSLFFESKEGEAGEDLIKIEQGNCSAGYFGGEALTPERNNQGSIVMKMSVCSAVK